MPAPGADGGVGLSEALKCEFRNFQQGSIDSGQVLWCRVEGFRGFRRRGASGV